LLVLLVRLVRKALLVSVVCKVTQVLWEILDRKARLVILVPEASVERQDKLVHVETQGLLAHKALEAQLEIVFQISLLLTVE